MSMDITRIGNLVRIERQRRGLTQATLAQMSNVSKGRIEAIENGRCLDMGLNTVNSVLVALGYSLSVGPVAS
jgi:transcriptional regulator with XRE-family HTH domain